MHVSRLVLLAFAAGALLLPSCDSKKPLSDPTKATADPRLVGAWQAATGNGVAHCHIGPREKFPAGVYYGVWLELKHDGTLGGPVEFVVFPSKVGDKGYLNVGLINKKHLQDVNTPEFKPEWIDSYAILQYSVDKGSIVVRGIDPAARKRALKDGKLKGGPDLIDDTSEHLAQFVAANSATLFSKQASRYERVKPPAKQPPKKAEP